LVVVEHRHLEQTMELLGLTQFSVLSHQSVVALAQEKVGVLVDQADQVVV
tara:strand:+ start:62 stop:211 length:150 start_codon:yes stop_codon:yes gene_type:complete